MGRDVLWRTLVVTLRLHPLEKPPGTALALGFAFTDTASATRSNPSIVRRLYDTFCVIYLFIAISQDRKGESSPHEDPDRYTARVKTFRGGVGKGQHTTQHTKTPSRRNSTQNSTIGRRQQATEHKAPRNTIITRCICAHGPFR